MMDIFQCLAWVIKDIADVVIISRKYNEAEKTQWGEKRRFCWLGLIVRNEKNHIPKRVWELKIGVKIKMRRPKNQ